MKLNRICLLFSFTALLSVAEAQFEGNALDFDGANDMAVATVPSFFGSIGSTDFTFEGWVYPRGNAFSRIFFAQSSTTNFATVSTSTSNQIYFYVVAGGTNYSTVTNVAMPTNQWTHVAARWTAATQSVEVFFNGVLQAGAGGGSSSNGTNGLMVLGSRPDGAQYFNGILDEVRVWSEARSSCEILTNMQNSINGINSNLVTSYNFNTGIGGGNNTGSTLLTDVSGSGYDCTLTNFTLNGATSNWVTSTATVNTSGFALGSYNTNASASVCSGSSYTFPDGSSQSNLTTQTIHVSNLTTINGCDSIVTTTVDILPTHSLMEIVWVCEGENYTFPDGSSLLIGTPVIHTSNLQTVNGCDSIMETTVNVLPSFQQNETATVCFGTEYTFPDGTSQNIQSQVIQVSNLQTINGCDSIITTTVDVLPLFLENESATVCSGDSYTFPDGTTQNNITAQTVYTSNLQSVNGCDSIVTTTVAVSTVNTNASLNGIVLTASANGATYQWINCVNNQPIAGEAGQSFTATANGDYAVVVTENNCSDTSNCISVLIIGLEEQSIGVLSAYPNPTNGKIHIEGTATLEGVNWVLTDISGKTVLSGTFSDVAPELDLSTFTKGIYLLQPEQQQSIRIVKE